MADKPTSTELATFDPSSSSFPVLFTQQGEGSIAQIIEDNFGDEGFDPTALDRLTVPSGGSSTYWTIPDEAPAPDVTGIIVHRQATRSFWVKKRGEGGEEDGPPDCASDDGQLGYGLFGVGSEQHPSGVCAECPMAQWDSKADGSKGKACKEQMQVFMLLEGSVLPTQVTFPPTSLQPWKKYMTRLASKGKSYYSVVTSLKLAITKGNGQTYATIVPERSSVLSPEEAQAARSYGSVIRAYFEQAAEQRRAQRIAGAQGLTPEGTPEEPAA